MNSEIKLLVKVKAEEQEETFQFYMERRDDLTLVVNIDTGVWKVSEKLNDFFDFALGKDEVVLDSSMQMYYELQESQMLQRIEVKKTVEDKYRLLIYEISEKCNLQCKYCFEDAQARGNNMTVDTALKAAELFMSLEKCADSLTVEFNGGESLINLSVIREVVPKILEIAQRKGKKVKFSLQTNGTLMTDDAAAFFKEYDIVVGISIDGTEEYNRNRVYGNGKGTFEQILGAIEILKKHEVRYSTVTVICQRGQFENTIKLAEYTGCREYRANLIAPMGREKKGASCLASGNCAMEDMAKEYIEFCRRVLDEKKYYESNLIYYLCSLLLWHPFMCYREPCGSGRSQLYVTANGEIYACQRSYYIGQGRVGLVDDSVEMLEKAIAENGWIQGLGERHTCGIESCKECPWKQFCCSCPCEGTGKEKDVENIIGGKNIYCDFNRYVLHELMWIAGTETEVVMNYLQYNY